MERSEGHHTGTGNIGQNMAGDKVRIDVTALEELQNSDVEDLILYIFNNKDSFTDFANSRVLKNREILLTTRVLTTVCKSAFRDIKITALSMFLNDSFTFNLYKIMGDLSKTQIGDVSWEDAVQLWGDLTKICENVLTLIADANLKMLHLLLNSLKINIPEFEYVYKTEISKEIKEKVEEMIVDLAVKESEKKLMKTTHYGHVLDPPDDFHHIPIYPSSAEVLNDESFLRPNEIKKAYRNVNHYLDVQFRLLREDFLRPLRTGVQACLSRSGTPNANVNIYRKVTFVGVEPVSDHCCVRLSLNANKSRKFFANSRRLMYGSLVCFTKDKFRSVVFGRICERNVEDLKKGEVIIEFDQVVPVTFNDFYTMIECKIYFEPYFQVLKALQNMSASDFPLEKYIVRVELTPKPPKYLIEREDDRFEFEQLLKWLPKIRKRLNLNDSQFAAFSSALTQKFAIIQGPPGTGKTYLGLALVKTLLQIERLWHKRSPILVICYTNRALDQFLEGVLEYTDKIVRVGVRSTSETLKKYTLKGLGGIRNCSVFAKLKHLNEISAKMKEFSMVLQEVDKFEGVIAFDKFEEILPHPWFHVASRGAIVNWLMEGREKVRNVKRDQNPQPRDEPQKDFLLITLNSLSHEIRNANGTKIADLSNKYYYLQMRLAQGKENKDAPPVKPTTGLTNPRTMSPDDRWNLYFYCLKMLKAQLNQTLNTLSLEYRSAYKEYDELRILETTKSLREAMIVGMTTTMAARLRPSLQSLRCPIVIVEEAAEILEAHIVASLTEYCQHLILIGDHQQLRPKTADFDVENRFKLGISLLERMVINSDQYSVLGVQHRMPPEISALISPIYPFLEDHSSVRDRPAIAGIDSCLFFIDHDHVEVECEGTTKKNMYEISFLTYLAKYLILNGYAPENITILTAYLGQMYGFQQEVAKHQDLKNVRIAILDNYQGEECDIILLSLVRNNIEDSVGFLSTQNRICVALSRARNGLYIMGNMTQLCKDSEVWINIRTILQNQGNIGPKLRLRCQVHPDVITYVKSDTDFKAIPNGGCTNTCATILECGHECNLVCHTQERDHEDYRCEEDCTRLLCDQNSSHRCQKKCYKKCGPCNYPAPRTLTCGHVVEIECHLNPETYECPAIVSVQLECAHTVEKPCFKNVETVICTIPCNTTLPCGHSCGLLCHTQADPDHVQYKCKKRCTRYLKGCSAEHKCRKLCHEECDLCTVLVKKERWCSHIHEVPCHASVDDLECTQTCSKTLECGHMCKRRCNEECGGCEVKVTKTYPVCGHSTKTKCSEVPNPKHCSKKCTLKLPCGHPCPAKCNEPCASTCSALVDCSIPTECGHTVAQIKCTMARSTKLPIKHCTQVCNTILKCGHQCSGNCNDCYQGRYHKRCDQKCVVPLICTHRCELPCSDADASCKLKCFYKCSHNSCPKTCGEVCVPCKKKCPRSCVHQECTEKCGDVCSVSACTIPCDKKLKCGHDCTGCCGDPCPQKCFICDEKYFQSGNKGRHVVLNDCKHIVEDSEVKVANETEFPLCPKCQSPIITTQRYRDFVKKTITFIDGIKRRVTGTQEENGEKKYHIQSQLFVLKQKSQGLTSVFPKINSVLESLEANFTKMTKKKMWYKYQLETLISKLNIIEYIIESCVAVTQPEKYFTSQVNFILSILKRDHDYFTGQEIEDISLETEKFIRMVEFAKLPDADGIFAELEPYFTSSERFRDLDNLQIKKLLREVSQECSVGGVSLEIYAHQGFKKVDYVTNVMQ